MELLSSNIKKTSGYRKPGKNSSISGNGNPKKASHILGNGTFPST